MEVSVHFGGLELSSEVLTRALRQFQLTGVMCAAVGVGDSDDRIAEIWQRYVPMGLALSLAEKRYQDGFVTENTPVVYNPSSWHQEALCGYAGRDFKLLPADLLTSHLECWLLGIRNTDVAADHFVKCLLWFYENNDRSLDRTLRFLTELHDAGFVVSRNLLQAIVRGFLMFYSRDADLSFMKGTTLADRESLNRELGRLRRGFEQAQESRDRFHAVMDWLIDYGFELAAKARGAETIDDWLTARARMMAPYSMLSEWFNVADDVGLGLVQRASLSQIDEIAQDLVSEFGILRFRADQQLPLVWDLDLANAIGREYRKHYSREEWFERVVEERVAAPDAVKKVVLACGGAEPGEVRTPEGWSVCTEDVAIPLCSVLGRDASSVRRWDFAAEPLEAAAAGAGGAPEGREKVTARRELTKREIEMYIFRIAWPEASLGSDLEEARLRYPWHAFFARSSGIALSLNRDLGSGIREIEAALLMDLRDATNWSALAKGAELTQRGRDAEFLNSVEGALVELSGGKR